jgi:uridine phosphorylase
MGGRLLKDSELILNDDGSVYHINLKPEHIADDVILVGDQGRVDRISRHFDKIEFKRFNREFKTHTGFYKGKRITVLSTGIGTDNIDIVVNELDAAVNIDLDKRQLKTERKSLNLIRIGTSGALHPDIPVGSHSISEFGLGFDGLLYYYKYAFSKKEQLLYDKINDHLNWNPSLSRPYIIESSPQLFDQLKENMIPGITATASGFYGPQGRALYLEPNDDQINDKLSAFNYEGHRITNFEMETSALYALGKMMGHHCCTTCAIIANRTIKDYSEDHIADVDGLIEVVLDRI